MSIKEESANETAASARPPLPGPVWEQMQQHGFTEDSGAALSSDITRTEIGGSSPVGQQVPTGLQRQFSITPPQPQQEKANAARVPIPPQHSQSQRTQPSPPTTGPMSSNVTIPPRPRPGRKPIPQEDAADRRRLQNRIAQRNFRDKRQQKLVETQIELEDKKKEYQDQVSELERQLDIVRKALKAAEDDKLKAEKRAADAEERARQAESRFRNAQQSSQIQNLPAFTRPALQSGYSTADLPTLNTNARVSARPYGSESNMMTPPEDNSNEIDYTYWHPSHHQPSINNFRPAAGDENGAPQVDFNMGGMQSLDDPCGFCTDDQNCSCKQEKRLAVAAAAAAAESVTVPGSCDMCLRDPARAQACRDLAAQTQMAARPTTSDGSRGYGIHAMGPPRTSCATLVDTFERYGERTSSASKLLGGRLHAWPATGGGYEVEEHEAAQVLQSLSRRNTIVSQSESNDRAALR